MQALIKLLSHQHHHRLFLRRPPNSSRLELKRQPPHKTLLNRHSLPRFPSLRSRHRQRGPPFHILHNSRLLLPQPLRDLELHRIDCWDLCRLFAGFASALQLYPRQSELDFQF